VGRKELLTMLLGQIDGELVEHLSCVPLERAEQRSTTVHDDKTKLAVIREQRRKGLKNVSHEQATCSEPVNAGCQNNNHRETCLKRMNQEIAD